MNYKIYGPFTIPSRGNNRSYLIYKEDINNFWSSVHSEHQGLKDACGCYVFAIRAGRGIKPWYVGKAQKQSFISEVFTDHKMRTFAEIMHNMHGTPVLFLISRLTNAQRFAKPSEKHKDIDFLETWLIADAIRKNKKLSNKKKTKFLKEIQVETYLNSNKKKNSSEKAFNLMFNK